MSDLFKKGYYEMIESPVDNNAWAIRILKGEFEGMLYSYGSVGVREDEELGEATIKFDISFLDIPDYKKDKKVTPEELERFKVMAHEILVFELKKFFEDQKRYEEIKASGEEPFKMEFDLDE